MAKSGLCERLRTVLVSLCCESTVVTLTLLSMLAITGEILIDYGILTAPADGDESHQQSTDNGSRQPHETSSANDQREALETVQSVFHYVSLAIAAGFFVEMVVKIAAFRRKFFMQPWQVVDLLVVCGSLAVEIAFEVNGRLPELEVITFVILIRLWRIPHACNIRAQEVQRDLEQEIEVWKAGTSKMQDRCNTLDTKSAKQKEKIERLERELAALKKAMKENNRVTRMQEDSVLPPVPNGSVPPGERGKGRTSSSNLLTTSAPHQGLAATATSAASATTAEAAAATGNLKPAARGHIRAASEDTTDGSPSRRRNSRGEEERDTEEDTVDEDDDEGTGRRNYFRSGSESSLSCHATEQEVHVQIEEEGGNDGAPTAGMTSSQKADVTSQVEGEGDDAPVQMRTGHATSSTGDKTEAAVGTELYHYDNHGYQPDLDDSEDFHGELLQEFDGARTYRSADGIPMTDL